VPPRRITIPALGLTVLLTGCGTGTARTIDPGDAAMAVATYAPADARAPAPAIRDIDAIQTTLDVAAGAFLHGDVDSLRTVLHDPAGVFGRRWLERVDNLAGVPLSDYTLTVDRSLPDLATERLRASYDRPVQVVYVVEEHALDGFDASGPAAEDLFLTVVETAEGWRIAGDRDAEPLGLVSVDHLWDHGPVVATVSGPVTALHHPDSGDVTTLLAEARRALTQAAARWPLAWSERVPILVPRDEDELAELLHVTFDLTNFIAFATATPVGELGELDLTGARVVINPARFLSRTSATRELILVHELLHVATRPVSGPMMPAWLDEGVAQALGERRSTTGTRLLDALVDGSVTLPTDGQFTVGGRDRIFLSYQLAWSFVDHLMDRFGTEPVARFYAAAGQGAEGQAGTEAWHVDRAAREVFGVPLDDLVAGWRAAR
jgi:hypothetical protein